MMKALRAVRTDQERRAVRDLGDGAVAELLRLSSAAAGGKQSASAPKTRTKPELGPRVRRSVPQNRQPAVGAHRDGQEGVRPGGGSRDHIAAELGREHGLLEDGKRVGWRDLDPRQGHPMHDDWAAVRDDGFDW
jgi:hypothetical protein